MQASKVLSHRACLALLGAVLWHGAAKANDLSVCIDKASPTVVADQKLAEAVAGLEGAKLTVFHFDGTGDGDDGFDVGDFTRLLAHDCDLVLGFPSGGSTAVFPAGLAATAPYGSTGFVLVTARDLSGATLAELPDDTEVAVTYGTAPNLYLIQHPKLQPDLHPTDAETIKTLLAGAVKAAMLWHPTVAATPGAEKFSVHPLNEPHATWNLVALHGATHKAAVDDFEKAINTLDASGVLARILGPYGIDAPPRPKAPVSTHTEVQVRDPIIKAAFDPKSAASPPALYTAKQAEAGEYKFAENCAQCHGVELEGESGPALTGPHFASKNADFKLGEVFTIVAQNMPAMEPGSLKPDEYLAIMAYLLQKNGYPAGTSELKFEAAKASTEPFIFHPK